MSVKVTIRFEPPSHPQKLVTPSLQKNVSLRRPPPPQMSMTIDLPQCQEQRRGAGATPPRPTKCQSEVCLPRRRS